MAGLQLKNLSKRLGAVEVIKDLSLDIADGEFIVFVGPSGCGKSTLIRMIAGLEEIDAGELLIDGRRVNEVGPASRGLAMVFQSYALYPHMTVRDNMGFSLRLARVSRSERERRVAEVARVLHLENYLEHKPAQLSGGQRQRVAIGRAIVRSPKVFLFDEPLSNLDAALRGRMRGELARLHEEIGATMIYVTHDQTEAMTMADRIVVLQAGRIEQVGAPLEIYRNPANLFVAGFIGSPPMNSLPGKVTGLLGGAVSITLRGDVTVSIQSAGKQRRNSGTGSSAITLDEEVTLGIRPEGLRLDTAGPLRGSASLVERLGSVSLLHVDLDIGHRVVAQVDASEYIRPHQRITLSIDRAHCHLFDGAGCAVRTTGAVGAPIAGAP